MRKMNMFIGTNGHHIITDTKRSLFDEPRIRLTAKALGSVPVDLTPEVARELGEYLIAWSKEAENDK